MRVWRESPTLYLPTFYVDVALFVGMVLMMIFTAWHLLMHLARTVFPCCRLLPLKEALK